MSAIALNTENSSDSSIVFNFDCITCTFSEGLTPVSKSKKPNEACLYCEKLNTFPVFVIKKNADNFFNLPFL